MESASAPVIDPPRRSAAVRGCCLGATRKLASRTDDFVRSVLSAVIYRYCHRWNRLSTPAFMWRSQRVQDEGVTRMSSRHLDPEGPLTNLSQAYFRSLDLMWRDYEPALM